MNRIATSLCIVLLFPLLIGPDCDGGAPSDDGTGGGGVPGACFTGGSDTMNSVRIHVVNAEDVANIQVTIMTPSGSCVIDPLPTATNAGLELGQAVYELKVDDIISFGAQSPSGGATGQCRVNQDAFTEPNSIFVDLFITSIGFVCSSGVDPVGSGTGCADVTPGNGGFGEPCRNDEDCDEGLPCCTSTEVSEACGVQVGLCECI